MTSSASTGIRRRLLGEPVPDLTTYRVVHRAMTTDLGRLTKAAAELVEKPDPARFAALRLYLDAVSGEIESHHRVEDEDVWPALEELAGERTALVPLTEDHERLDPLLRRAAELAALDRATPELADVLGEITGLLVRHIADEERDVFPIIEDCMRVEDYAALQKRFASNLRPRLLPFLAPWAVRHATPGERAVIVGEAGAMLRVLLALFERRFTAREQLLFG
jgi:hemerythrin-like domain-containing protein